ncbi:HD domain-containing protein [soil metagenome]
MAINKKKIFNDPVYGFITIPDPLIFDLIEHPWFQRLRRIRQLGLSHLVYPGALHTRFHHALGALHLMGQAIETIRSKGHEITEDEALGAQVAILLHDIGHSPYSHALEHSIVTGISHEKVSLLFMDRLNIIFKGKLSTGIRIFKNEYPKKFLHQLVSSQLDMDRLDYLNRDSFYTGVLEGRIGAQRIIKMLDINNDRLVVEEKGIYSIEKFIIARRLMYWQVYLHKTVLAAEQMLVCILNRAKYLSQQGAELFATPIFHFFLKNEVHEIDFIKDPTILDKYAKLDDYDIYASIKVWADHEDTVLSRLCSGMVDRSLFKIKLRKEPFFDTDLVLYQERIKDRYRLKNDELSYFAFLGSISNSAYDPKDEQIRILYRDGSLLDLTAASDQLDVAILSSPVQKYFLCVLPELIE